MGLCFWFCSSSIGPKGGRISDFLTAKEVWDYLLGVYQQSNVAKRYKLETAIQSARQRDQTIQDFYIEMTGLWNQLALMEPSSLKILDAYVEFWEQGRLVQFLTALSPQNRLKTASQTLPPSVFLAPAKPPLLSTPPPHQFQAIAKPKKGPLRPDECAFCHQRDTVPQSYFGLHNFSIFCPPLSHPHLPPLLHLFIQISDQLESRVYAGLSLPQICENFTKAAYDPRISGIYLHIEPLNCGWGKVQEIRRHMLDFKKSGKFIVGYAPAYREKEYYLACGCEELYCPPSAYFSLYGLTVQASFLGGIDPQVQKVGKYKSVGDQLTHKNMSEENCEMLTSLLDSIHGNWLDNISLTKGKKIEDIENFINEGVYQVERLKEDGWITNIKYDDEIMSKLKERLGIQNDKNLPTVDYRKYSMVRKWTVGLSGGKDLIAVITASGRISRAWGLNVPSSGIVGEQFIEKIRRVRESKRFKAVVIRIDSPGGDALASDLMWREIRLLAASKPVIASMADVAASGGYYTAMAAGVIVAEDLTLTGSIGVVTGRFAELTVAEHRPFRPDEAELFAKSAQNAYKQFRDKAAYSRSMTVDKMEEVAQGRVWTGKEAVSRGLVDAIGGFSRAVAIAKQKANIPLGREVGILNVKVTLVELSRPSPTLPEILVGIGNTVVGVDRTLQELLQDLASSDEIQARMDGIMFQKLDGSMEKTLEYLRRDERNVLDKSDSRERHSKSIGSFPVSILRPFSEDLHCSEFNTLLKRMKHEKLKWDNSFNVRGISTHLQSPIWIFWLNDVLSTFAPILKKCGIYAAIYVSQFAYARNVSLLKGFLEQWSPDTNTFHTIYGELGISLWDLHRISGLPICGEFYEEFTPSNDILYSSQTSKACRGLFNIYASSCQSKKFNHWTFKFIDESPTSISGFQRKDRIPDDVYLSGFLAS
ncbi:hypothetical protein HYC85_030211 [Camellia sinensis]|uniref:Peptidase S49 domain-containing protein n=1 Tax=Camellia sinensis TaxID=4442 RepID=A0A7J7G022_CAMSI|nr:hypothetical protein HYC85_030211 [Camellia sinensis]